jgi:hypothetical protein
MPPPRPETLQKEAPEEPTARRPMWELSECNCPELCERDHEVD